MFAAVTSVGSRMSRLPRMPVAIVGLATAMIATIVVAAPSSNAASCVPAETVVCSASTIVVSGTYDGGGRTLRGNGGAAGEGSPMIMEVLNGGTVKNVTLAPTTAGIACLGSCTLQHVRWIKAGDYAAAALGGAGTTMKVINSVVDNATDKAFQHNGPGTVLLYNVKLGSVGHIYASCGNCGSGPRHVSAKNVHANSVKYDGFAVQTFDTRPFLSNVTIGSTRGLVCAWYNGNGSLHKRC